MLASGLHCRPAWQGDRAAMMHDVGHVTNGHGAILRAVPGGDFEMPSDNEINATLGRSEALEEQIGTNEVNSVSLLFWKDEKFIGYVGDDASRYSRFDSVRPCDVGPRSFPVSVFAFQLIGDDILDGPIRFDEPYRIFRDGYLG